jgi:pimeloyl-ACP methyl ester carboxylesterase
VSGRSAAIETRFGRLEYAQAGHGPPFLMIHGTGGGFDQGLGMAEGLLPHGYRIIAPSRFGYLGSAFPADPSSENQADAFVELLDRLKIRKLPVAGGSAGALSAVQFALRHPERCSALILIVPAANVRGRDPVQMSRIQAFFVRRLATSNFLFWLALKTRRDQMISTLLATDPAQVDRASPAERRRVDRILEEIMPVARRSDGMLNDARLAGAPARVDFSRLKVPTLVISVEDDRFGTARTARDIAAMVPGSRLVIYPHGGHIWIGHNRELWAEVARFVAGGV